MSVLVFHEAQHRGAVPGEEVDVSVPVFGWIIKGMGLIPVNRDSNPSAVLAPTREALTAGEVVGIYPEGTLTRDPDQWPMEFKSGAARLALDTGVTVIPLSHD